MNIHAVIMAGGGGTRFWPRSRQKFPKQFLKLAGDRSLIQMAFDRIEALAGAANTWVITSAAQEKLVAEQIPGLSVDRIVGEPCGRDTAACIGLGAALVAAQDKDAVMIAMPADHVIEPVQEFRRAAQAAAQLALDHPNALLTFGIPPTYPAVGYGYIHRGPQTDERQGVKAFKVEAFKEKPAAETAQEYVSSGEYFWNSGIFVWRAATMLNELEKRQPAIYAAVRNIAQSWGGPDRLDVFRNEYEPLKKISIDYAVMEAAQEVLVLETPFSWDDLGSWPALERMNPQDGSGNTILSPHIGVDTNGCLIVGEPDSLIATVGVENLVIVRDGNAVLVAHKEDEVGIKKLVEKLKEGGVEGYL